VRPETLRRKRYPADWRLRSRFVRHFRARGRCEFCGALDKEPHPDTGAKVHLAAAHLHDRTPENARLLNLVALCQRCHNRHNVKSRLRNKRNNRDKATGQLRFFFLED